MASTLISMGEIYKDYKIIKIFKIIYTNFKKNIIILYIIYYILYTI